MDSLSSFFFSSLLSILPIQPLHFAYLDRSLAKMMERLGRSSKMARSHAEHGENAMSAVFKNDVEEGDEGNDGLGRRETKSKKKGRRKARNPLEHTDPLASDGEADVRSPTTLDDSTLVAPPDSPDGDDAISAPERRAKVHMAPNHTHTVVGSFFFLFLFFFFGYVIAINHFLDL